MANFIPYKKYDGKTNMLIDESILNDSINNELGPTLRFYGWTQPTLSLGRNQSYNGINLNYCENNDIDLVKRPTGGRAVFHNNELTYSFICPVNILNNGKSVIESYKEISEALIIGLKELGIELQYPEYKKVTTESGYCMAISTGSDLLYKNKKLIGSAQLRRQNYILQHGSLLLDIDNQLLAKIFNFENINSDFITIKQINPELLNVDTLSAAIKSGFEKKFELSFVTNIAELANLY